MSHQPGTSSASLLAAVAEDAFRLEWISKEVEILERKVELYDGLLFKIKGWAITAWSALMTFALSEDNWRIATVAATVPLLFMFLDASYKRYQVLFIARTRVIMKLLNEPQVSQSSADAYSFPVYDLLCLYGQRRADRDWGSGFSLMTRASVGILYWVLLTISMLVVIVQLTRS